MKRTIQIVVGLALGLGLLWLLFHDTDWRRVAQAIRDASVGGLCLATGLVVATFFCRVQRWSYIVRTAKPVSFRHLFNATQIGFLGNFTLPGRIGEVIRAFVLARLAKLPFGEAMAMAALDRVFDLGCLVVVIVLVVFTYSPVGRITLPKEVLGFPVEFDARLVRWAEEATTIGLLLLLAGLVVLYWKPRFFGRATDVVLGRFSKRLAARVREFVESFAAGLRIFRSASEMAKCFLASLFTWFLCVFIFVVLLWSFGIRAPWYTSLFIELLLAVMISVPGAPGFIGQFQAAIVVGLVMVVPEVDYAKAAALSIVAYLINLFPVILVGVFSLTWEGFGLAELTRETAKARAELDG